MIEIKLDRLIDEMRFLKSQMIAFDRHLKGIEAYLKPSERSEQQPETWFTAAASATARTVFGYSRVSNRRSSLALSGNMTRQRRCDPRVMSNGLTNKSPHSYLGSSRHRVGGKGGAVGKLLARRIGYGGSGRLIVRVQGPRVPLAGLREDDGKCTPCLSYPPPSRCCLRRVGGCHHRLSQIRPRRLARVQANAAVDCANPPHTCLRVRDRCCTTKPRGYTRAMEDCL